MTGTSRLIAILLALNVALIAAGALFIGEPPPRAGTGLRVALVFNIGGKNDRSFNEAAYRGLERAKSAAFEYARNAQAALEALPESSYKETLAALAYYVIDRNR